MNDEYLQTIEQVKQFLAGSGALQFQGVSIEERYRWIETVYYRIRNHQLMPGMKKFRNILDFDGGDDVGSR